MLAAEQRGAKVHVGFSVRYHRTFRKARELFETRARWGN